MRVRRLQSRNPAARLYAPVEDQHRPQETPPVEQGKAVVLSHIFSPPAWVGAGRGGAHRYVGEDCGVGQQTTVWIAICLPSFSLQNKAGAAIGSARLRLCFVFVSVTGQKRSFRTRSGAVPKFFWSFSFKKRTQGFWRRGAARTSSLRSRRSLLSRAAKRASSPMRSMAAPSRSFW